MSEKIFISIIIPCYNCEKWVLNTIDSLLIQDNKSFEVIFIDDGSKDMSLQVIQDKMKNSRLKYKIISKKNEGVSVARNIGISQAVGEYIYFLDSDDYIESNFISRLNQIINEENFDMVFFNYKNIINDTCVYGRKKYQKFNIKQDSKEVLSDIFAYKFEYHMCAFIVKNNIINDNSIRFVEGARYGEDHEFIIKCLVNSENVVVINDILFNYFMRSDSVMHSFTLSRLDSIESAVRVKDYIYYYYSDENIRELSKKYVADKIMLNLMAYGSMKKNVENKCVEKKLLELIGKNKNYLKYFGYNTGSKKDYIYRILSYNTPKIFINIMYLTRNLRRNNKL